MKTFLKQCKWGQFLLLRGEMISQYADLYGEWCELEVALFSQLLGPGSNVVEVGAHIGLHTIALSKLAPAGRIVCFEPQRPLFQMLCANAALNDRMNIEAQRAAVGRESGVARIEEGDYDIPWNYSAFSLKGGFSAEQPYPGETRHESVPVMTLDQACEGFDSLSIIKVDAEGMELDVLAGAGKTIDRLSPALFVENNQAASGDSLIEAISDLGYECFWYCVSRYRDGNFNGVPWVVPGNDVNMICLPAGDSRLPAGLQPAREFAELERGAVHLVKQWPPDRRP